MRTSTERVLVKAPWTTHRKQFLSLGTTKISKIQVWKIANSCGNCLTDKKHEFPHVSTLDYEAAYVQ